MVQDMAVISDISPQLRPHGKHPVRLQEMEVTPSSKPPLLHRGGYMDIEEHTYQVNQLRFLQALAC